MVSATAIDAQTIGVEIERLERWLMSTLERVPWRGEITTQGVCATIPPDVRATMERVSFAQTEVCGLLLGSGLHVERVLLTDNVAADPALNYVVSAEALLAASRLGEVIGVFHTHTYADTTPSASDAAQAQIGWLYVIGAQGSLAAYLAR